MSDSGSSSDSLVALLRGLEEGKSAAEAQLLAQYLEKLTRLAARRIGSDLQAKVNSNAVANAALNSFIRQYPKSDWEVLDRHALWLLLAGITRRKCARERRPFLTQKRDARKETPPVRAADAGEDASDYPAVGPRPDEVVMFQDLLRWVLEQGDETVRRIVRLRLDGEDMATISQQVGVSERTVARRLNQLRDQLQKQLED